MRTWATMNLFLAAGAALLVCATVLADAVHAKRQVSAQLTCVVAFIDAVEKTHFPFPKRRHHPIGEILPCNLYSGQCRASRMSVRV